jgi:hypothetical protein
MLRAFRQTDLMPLVEVLRERKSLGQKRDSNAIYLC